MPQWLPLSPILFLFYNVPLLEAVNQPNLQLSALGFADNFNLLTYSELAAANCIALELAHNECLTWASTHGMQFALGKYVLTHFTQRNSFDLGASIRIGDSVIAPSPVVRILG